MGKQVGHYALGVDQIVAGLEQGGDGQRGRVALAVQAQTVPIAQQQDGQHVVHIGGHADDVGADNFTAVNLDSIANHRKQPHQLIRLAGQPLERP